MISLFINDIFLWFRIFYISYLVLLYRIQKFKQEQKLENVVWNEGHTGHMLLVSLSY